MFRNLFRKKTRYEQLIDKANWYAREARKHCGKHKELIFRTISDDFMNQARRLTIEEAFR